MEGNVPFFSDLFSEDGLTPHGFCLLWQPGLIWLHVASDAIIGVSYYAIPSALAYFVWKRSEIDFGWVFWMFAGFIFACGTTHFFDVWTLWHPDYGIQGVVKAITAAISLVTAILMWPVVSRLLQLPSRAQLRGANDSLYTQIRERNAVLEQMRLTEERHRLLMESVAPFAIVMLDRQGYVTDWTLGTQRVFRYTTQEIVGKHISMLYIPEDRECGVPTRSLEIAAREGRYETEEWHVRKDGSRFWASVIAHRLIDERGQFVGFFKVTRDITAQRERDEELRWVRAELVQSQKMEAVGQLTGGISHDFNNILTVVLGNIELAEADIERDEGHLRRRLGGMRRAAERGAALTQRLLAFSRRQALCPQNTNVNHLMNGTYDLLQNTLGERISIERMLDDGLWQAFVDASQLENAVVNLALNARDAMPSGGTLTIETSNVYLDDDYAAVHSEVTPGQYVMVGVSDTGTGMSAETVARAFEPFFTTKPLGEGTGLGLSQVYGFVGQSNGHVRIYSELGSGTSVKIYLPRSLGADELSVSPLAEAELPSAQATVLVVEDDPEVREYIVSALTRLRYRVLDAAEASAALTIIDFHPELNLLVTDLGLPGINGRQLAEEASRRRAGIKVLFISGYARQAVVQNGVLDSGVELLSKPFSMNSLGKSYSMRDDLISSLIPQVACPARELENAMKFD
jgi:PAS domain S-box-containing protein